jgi:ABC-type uncharacterized transport system auxiliary subunit
MKRIERQTAQSDSNDRKTCDPWKMIGTAVLLAAIISGFVGCASTKPDKFYQLSVPNSAAVAPSNDRGVTLTVAGLTAIHLYQQDGIVYTAVGGHMGTYGHDRWTAAPTSMIEQVLLRDLRSSGRYRGVFTLRSNPSGDFIVQGRIHDFKEVDMSKASILARVSFELELRDRKTGATVWTHQYTHDEPVSGKDLNAVVAAFDTNVQRGVGEATSSLDQYFASHDQAVAAGK